ncbi:murein biosynthesis integral membrane protein MurJ [Aquabacterium sp.]|uniref:murein biosynthesis integral membrane protein MurJ n=1 Tax=Aquabacterium sp. TaxID=1872578 RepID=UPI003D6CEB0C
MKQTIQLGMLSVANLGLAFLGQWYVLTQLGAGIETDALFAGMTVPQLVLMVISGSLMHVLVPLLSGENDASFAKDAWGFFFLVGGVFGILALTLYAAAPWWVPLTVPGFGPEGLALTMELTRIQLIGMVFSAVNGVQWAAYHAKQQFLVAEIMPMLTSLLAFLALISLLPKYGVAAAAWLGTARITVQTVLLLPGLGKPVWPDLRSPTLNEAWKRIKPLLWGTVYYKTDPLLDRFLLSNSSSGSLSLYHLAQQIYSAGSQIIVKTFAAPLVPILSNLNKNGQLAQFRQAYRRRIIQIAAIGIVVLMILAFAGQFLLQVLVGYGNISASDVSALWFIMICLGGTFLGGVLGQISSSAFYALGDTATPTRLGMLSYTIYVPIKVLVFYSHGLMGLALSTSGFLMVNFVLQSFFLKNKLDTHQRSVHP